MTIQQSMTTPTWQTLQQSAERARQRAHHEEAIDLYTQALTALQSESDPPWEAVTSILMARADSCSLLGRTVALTNDLSVLADLAEKRQDYGNQSIALARLSDELRFTGEIERAFHFGEKALITARQSGITGLIVEALSVLGTCYVFRQDFDAAKQFLQNAQELAHPLDEAQQIAICRLKISLCQRLGQIVEGQQAAEEGLRLARSLGQRVSEGRYLNQLSIFTTDQALRGIYITQALEIFESLGARLYQNMMLMNGSNWWAQLGLYEKSAEAAQKTLQAGRLMQQDWDVLYSLQFLGLALCELGDFSSAQASIQEAILIARQTNDSMMEATMLGIHALTLCTKTIHSLLWHKSKQSAFERNCRRFYKLSYWHSRQLPLAFPTTTLFQIVWRNRHSLLSIGKISATVIHYPTKLSGGVTEPWLQTLD